MNELDIVIPVYNEGAGIIQVLQGLRKAVKTPFRILLCYDFPEDTTLTVLTPEATKGLNIELVLNQGKGAHAAVLSGFKHSTAPAVLVYPGDDITNAGIVDPLYQQIMAGSEIAAPSRFIPGGCMVGCSWLKDFLVRTVAFTLYYIARVPIHDPTNGFRMFSRRAIEEIPIESTRGFTYSIEMLVKAHRMGWKITEYPAQWFERRTGESRFRVMGWAGAYLRWYFYAFQTAFLMPFRVLARLGGF